MESYSVLSKLNTDEDGEIDKERPSNNPPSNPVGVKSKPNNAPTFGTNRNSNAISETKSIENKL